MTNEIMLYHTYRVFFTRLEGRTVSFLESSGGFKSIQGQNDWEEQIQLTKANHISQYKAKMIETEQIQPIKANHYMKRKLTVTTYKDKPVIDNDAT